MPVFVITVLFIPGVSDRVNQGFSDDNRNYTERLIESPYFEGTEKDYALYSITSGRSFAWPFVLDKIYQGPLIGYGCDSMVRTGLARELMLNYSESFRHPHNAYLQFLMDNGLLGSIPVMIFYVIILSYSTRLLRDTRYSLFVVTGGVTVSIITATMIGSLSSHSFYPEESSVGIWCVIGLMFRILVERARIDSSDVALTPFIK
jgi:O-antigen ligase